EACLEDDVVGLEDLGGALELLVETAKRRAAIAGDVAGRLEPGAAVALLLHQREAHQRLVAGDKDPALGQIVIVLERDLVERHLRPLANARRASSRTPESGKRRLSRRKILARQDVSNPAGPSGNRIA